MRMYLKKKYDNNEKDICILGYRSSGKATRSRKTLLDIINFDTDEYVCDHSCQQYSNRIADPNSFIIADATIYEYARCYEYYRGIGNKDVDYGLCVYNIRSQVTVCIYKGNPVFVPSRFNIWHFTSLYIHIKPHRYNEYDFDLTGFYDVVTYGQHSFHINKDNLWVIYAGYGVPDNEGYQVEEETDEYYILYYSAHNSRIKAYKALEGWVNDYKSTQQNQYLALSAGAQM